MRGYVGDYGWWIGNGVAPILLFSGFVVLITVALVKFWPARSPAVVRVPRRISLEPFKQSYGRDEIFGHSRNGKALIESRRR